MKLDYTMADFTNFAFIVKLNSSEIIQLPKILLVLHKKWYIVVLKYFLLLLPQKRKPIFPPEY